MGGSAPKAPDYQALARQQAVLDRANVNYQTGVNRPTIETPFGTLKWKTDANGNWIQTQELDPRIAANLGMLGDASVQATQALTQQGAYDPYGEGKVQRIENFNPYQMTAGEYTGERADKYADAFTQSLLSRIAPQQGIDRDQMETKLRLQGLQPGTQAYDSALGNLLRSQGDVNAKAQLDGMLYGNQEARADYNQRLAYDQLGAQTNLGNSQGNVNVSNAQMGQYDQVYAKPLDRWSAINGALGTSYQPVFQQYGGNAGTSNPADILGATQQSYAQQVARANAKTQKNQQTGSAVGTVVGSFFGPWGAAAGGAIGGAAGGAV